MSDFDLDEPLATRIERCALLIGAVGSGYTSLSSEFADFLRQTLADTRKFCVQASCAMTKKADSDE